MSWYYICTLCNYFVWSSCNCVHSYNLSTILFLLQSGQTPLHIAVKRGHSRIVEALIFSGAKLDIRDEVSTYNNVMYCVINMVIIMNCLLTIRV